MKQRKKNIIEKINNLVDDKENKNKDIHNLYIEIIKLLILDNSYKKLVEIYLIWKNRNMEKWSRIL